MRGKIPASSRGVLHEDFLCWSYVEKAGKKLLPTWLEVNASLMYIRMTHYLGPVPQKTFGELQDILALINGESPFGIFVFSDTSDGYSCHCVLSFDDEELITETLDTLDAEVRRLIRRYSEAIQSVVEGSMDASTAFDQVKDR